MELVGLKATRILQPLGGNESLLHIPRTTV